jgi:DNA-binding response OmpR family regulator
MAAVRTHGGLAPAFGGRLNVLLTERDEPWAQQLPRLLEPQGVRTVRVHSVDEAVDAIEHESIHAAVVDLGLPLDGAAPVRGLPETGGLKLLRIIRRMRPAPPAVVVRGRLFDRRTDDRMLTEALKLEVFSVLDQPVQLEQMLETLRRLLQRHYGGTWPA